MIALTPAGRLLDDALVDELADEPALTLLCGRYEGFDQRVLDHFVTEEISIGRYVLAGGELAAMVLCDAVLRKLPGSLGHEHSALEESFSPALEGAPEYPHYTRPAELRGWRVPEVLLSGHHARIARWRREPEPPTGVPQTTRYHRPPPRPEPGSAVVSGGRSLLIRPPPVTMSTVIDSLERAQLRRVPQFDAGDRLRVHFQVIEGTRRRTQVFEGVVIKRQGHGARETFTVRKQSFGVGVERTFPLHSPKIERIEVAARGDVRRAKLYYLRGRVGKRARVRERRYSQPEVLVERELLYGPEDAPPVDTVPDPETVAETEPEAVDTPEAVDSPRRGRAGAGGPGRRPVPGCGSRRRIGVSGRSLAGSPLELAAIVAAALGLALLIQAFVINPYRIPSGVPPAPG